MSILGKIKTAVGAPAMAIKAAVNGGSAKDVFNAAAKGSVGGQILSGVVGENTVAGKALAGDFTGAAASAKGTKDQKAAQQQAEMDQRNKDQFFQNQNYAAALAQQDKDYLSSMQGNVGKYQTDLNQLQSEAQASQQNAANTYNNEIQPRLKDLMTQAQKNSQDAMSLKDATDPNNKIATSVRDLYNKQGQTTRDLYNQEADTQRGSYNDQGANVQKLYEQQATNEGRKGLADAGVLSALGMQNMAGQLGNIPMTGGQLQALMGANQSQTASAYANTQQRLQSLRDQGIQGNIGLQNKGLDTASTLRSSGLGRMSDLSAQGLDQGFNRSDTAYNQGQQAIQDYGQSVGNYESASDRQLGRDQGFRSERGGLSGQTYGLQQQMTDATRGVANAGTSRDMAIYNQYMGGQQADSAAKIAQLNAQQAQQAQMVTGGLQAAGTIGGAVLGGPAGAAAGGAVGQQVGGAMAPQANSIPQYGNYGTYSQYQPSNYVQQSSQNPTYGGVTGMYGQPGQGGLGLSLYDKMRA